MAGRGRIDFDMTPGPNSTVPHRGFGATDAMLVLMAIIWGVNYTVVKAGLEYLQPLAFNGARMGLATIVLFIIAPFMARGVPWPNARGRRQLLTIGVVGNGVYQLLFILGMQYTRAGVAALILAAAPAWVAIIARMMGREQISQSAWTGIALQLLGVVFVVGSAFGMESSGKSLYGALLMALGSMCWALYTVLAQPHTLRAHPLHLSALTMLSGAVLVIAAALPGLRHANLSAVPFSAWSAVLYSSLGAIVIGYLLYYRGVRVLGPTRASMYGNLQPVVALIVAWAALHEHPTAVQWLGAALILGGLLLSRNSRGSLIARINREPVARSA